MDDFDIPQTVLFMLGLVVAVLWLLLPFAVFRIKDRLDTLIELVEKNTEAVLSLRERQ